MTSRVPSSLWRRLIASAGIRNRHWLSFGWRMAILRGRGPCWTSPSQHAPDGRWSALRCWRPWWRSRSTAVSSSRRRSGRRVSSYRRVIPHRGPPCQGAAGRRGSACRGGPMRGGASGSAGGLPRLAGPGRARTTLHECGCCWREPATHSQTPIAPPVPWTLRLRCLSGSGAKLDMRKLEMLRRGAEAAGWVDRTRGGGPGPGGGRSDQPADRGSPRDQPQDGRPAPVEHLCQVRAGHSSRTQPRTPSSIVCSGHGMGNPTHRPWSAMGS